MLNVERAENSCDTSVMIGSNVDVSIHGIGHDAENFDLSHGSILSQISRSNFVGVESDDSLLHPENTGTNLYYKKLINASWKQQKPVICSDPSVQNKDVAYGDFIGGAVSMFTAGMTSISLLEQLAHRRYTRREFLKLLLIASSATLFHASGLGKGVQLAFDCDTTVSHPQLDDNVSFTEYRNACTLLGFELLNREGILQKTYGIQYIGRAHIPGFKGFTNGNELDVERTLKIFNNNFIGKYCDQMGTPASVRVWVPDTNQYGYSLQYDIPISSYFHKVNV